MNTVAGLTLYEHRESVCCHKVAITLCEKQIEPEIIGISLEKQEQRQPWYLALNPLGVVPTLVHDGRTIIQSTIITEYLDDAFPERPLMPHDPYWRARRRLWARRIDDGLHVHIATISFIIAFAPQYRARMGSEAALNAYLGNIADPRHRDLVGSWFKNDINSDLLRQSLRAYHGFLQDMETALSEMPWLAGPDYSLADIDVIPYIWRLSNLQLSFMWDKFPGVADWFNRVTTRAAFKTAIIDQTIPEWVGGMHNAGSAAKATLENVVMSF
jgi:glutathione S-transferase